MAVAAFYPADASTVSIDVSASTQVIQVSARTGPVQVRICNAGSATAWIRAGGSGVVATTSGIPILAGDIEVMSFQGTGALYIAAIAAGATGKIYFTEGGGI